MGSSLIRLSLLIVLAFIIFPPPLLLGFTKVVVPAVFNDWKKGIPDWFSNNTLQSEYGYTVFLYQKSDPAKPNYISTNRGTEGGVYLRYIVDHYDTFPDVAIFVQGRPEVHEPNWLRYVRCARPTAGYYSFGEFVYRRRTDFWRHHVPGMEVWVEQCWRDLLKIAWGIDLNDHERLERRIPASKPVEITAPMRQQFILSREMVHRRPLAVWKHLHHTIAVQSVCHEGEPDFAHLYAMPRDRRSNQLFGPERPNITGTNEGSGRHGPGYGRHTQGGTMEHLAHVVFGHHDLIMRNYTMEDKCRNFLPNCPNSPCEIRS